MQDNDYFQMSGGFRDCPGQTETPHFGQLQRHTTKHSQYLTTQDVYCFIGLLL